MPPALALRFWAGHLLALVAVAAAVGLGLWQLDAWSQRRTAEATDLTRLEPVPLDSVIGPDDPFPGRSVGRPVSVAGTWVPGGTVLISDREQDGTDGFWVVTPIAVGGDGAPAVPVVRGWVATPADAPTAPTGTVSVVGLLQPADGSDDIDPDPTDDILPQLRIADVVQRVDQDLYGAYVVQTDAPGPGLVTADPAQLPQAGRFTALRNFLYAIEWWIFGAFAVFVWWRWVCDVNRDAADEDETAEAPGLVPLAPRPPGSAPIAPRPPGSDTFVG